MKEGNWIDAKMSATLSDTAKEVGIEKSKLTELIVAYFKYIRICMASFLFPEITIPNFGLFKPSFYKLQNKKKFLEDEGCEDPKELEGITWAIKRLEIEKNRRRRTKLKKLKR